ncbi:MAG TPA: HAMP domain-containing sensor histidine kinase [Solirubrobacteraceae bacterium]|nr:HAMP domain-containing sensor histidine kinase [Solirubrobacteraceae bacterium]
MLVTAAAALAVAAVTLLSQLESSLRNADQRALNSELRRAVKPFEKLRPGEVIYTALHPTEGTPGYAQEKALVARGTVARDRLTHAASRLAGRVGASYVVVLGYPNVDGQHAQRVVVAGSPDLAQADPYSDAAQPFRTDKPRYTPGTINGTDYARAAIPFNVGSQRWVLAVRTPLNDVSSAVAAVRTAILDAALVAAALTLLLAIPFAVTVVRRLRRLRQAALRVAQEGPTVEIPVDRALDEVGDLARTFALMQQQLRHQEEARRAFVATASHELRTPVASLDGLLELLDEDLQSGQTDMEDARSLIARARAQSRRLGRLAADLLDLSRIDARTDLRSEPVELSELSRAVLAEFDLGTARRRIVTVLDDSAGSVWALGDPGSVARILRILLDNAVRLSPDGGVIKVELRNGDRASLSVCDQGPGVPAEEREMIFERFMRGRAAGGKAGFGLGLAIGRELAHRMGGELVLEDQGEPGARFTLRLPVSRASQEEPVALA